MVEGWIGGNMSLIQKMSDKQREAAAKELCRIKGLHPNQMMAYAPDPHKPDQIIHMESWRMAEKLIEAQEQVEMAMSHGRMLES